MSLLGGLLGLGRSLLLSLFGRLLLGLGGRSGLGLRGGFGGGGRSRGFVAARERDGTDESGGGGGEKLGVECHDVVSVQLLAVSVLLLRALSYMYAVSRMAVRPTGRFGSRRSSVEDILPVGVPLMRNKSCPTA